MTSKNNGPTRDKKSNKYNLSKEELAEYMKIVERYNEDYMELWMSTPYEKRGLFLPHCMRHSSECQSTVYEFGRLCVQCDRCQLGALTATAKELGMPSYIVPGGSMLIKIINKNMPVVSMGVACPFELAEAMEKMTAKGCPMVGEILIRDGCKDTATDLDRALKLLRAKNF